MELNNMYINIGVNNGSEKCTEKTTYLVNYPRNIFTVTICFMLPPQRIRKQTQHSRHCPKTNDESTDSNPG